MENNQLVADTLNIRLDQCAAMIQWLASKHPGSVLLGRAFEGVRVAQQLVGIELRPGAASATKHRGALLTSREEEVLRLAGLGLSNREIAKHLYVAIPTVKNHVHNVLTKLRAGSRREAVELYRDYPCRQA